MGRLVETEQSTYNGRIIGRDFIERDVMPEARGYIIELEGVGLTEVLLCGDTVYTRVGKRGNLPEEMRAPWDQGYGSSVVVHATTKNLLGRIPFSRSVNSIEATPVVKP